MKTIAFYLPQFHEIEENNRAWGQGFTEWDNVKKACCLFEDHRQPRVPLDGNYYNLLDDKTPEWQVALAKTYGIDGFCFYHYWFKDGKQVLQKPVELFRGMNLHFPYCFAWANEPWTKTWHGAGGEKEILLEQRYGKEDEWKAHYEYFRTYFLDDFYIRIDNKPVLMIYQINKIPCFSKMVDCWNELAHADGLEGIFIVDMLTDDGKVSQNKRVCASVDFEPGKDVRSHKNPDELNIQSYDDICMKMLGTKHNKNQFRCMFVDYDDSPRRGEKGTIVVGSTPQRFGELLQMTYNLSEEEGNEYVFLNAWNEWGEGNYLEPDEHYRYSYLQAVQNAIGRVYDLSSVTVPEIELSEEDRIKNKFRNYYELCNQWIKNTNDGYSVADFFRENGYHEIAVYGLGELGNRLIEALEGTDVHVKYGIDKNTWAAFAEIDVVGLDERERFDDVDCIVVTPIHAYDSVLKSIEDKCDCKILSLETVIYGI